MLTIGHWQVGDIECANGKIRVIPIDSSGLIDLTKKLIVTMEKHLTIQGIKPEISFDPTQVQCSRLGCGVFYLDTLQHLFTLEKYLKPSVFDYLDKQENKTICIRQLS